MASTVIDSKVFGALFSTDEMRRVFSDLNLVQKWLDTETALAQAQGELGVIPKTQAEDIVKYADAKALNIDEIGEFYKSSITIVPLLKAFKEILPDNAGEYVHWGATSQDIVDTGLILQEKEAYQIILRDMKVCQQHVLNLVKKYKDTIMCGRTHVIHALPITLGYKVAVWADELGRDIQRLEEIEKRVFVGQMSGAVGTLASQPEKGLETQQRMMEILGLGQPTSRDWRWRRPSSSRCPGHWWRAAAAAGPAPWFLDAWLWHWPHWPASSGGSAPLVVLLCQRACSATGAST